MENYVIFSVIYVCENTTTMETKIKKTLHFPGQTAAPQHTGRNKVESTQSRMQCIKHKT